MRLFLLGLALLAGDVIAQSFVRVPSAPLLPVSSFSPFHRRPVQAPVRSFSRPVSVRQQYNRDDSDPCSDACGPNTVCEVKRASGSLSARAQCRCQEGYVPNEHTIIGCKPQCTSNNDCPDDYQCSGNKCVRVCQPGACGLNADCEARNHQRDCKCPPNYGGDPNTRCTRVVFQQREVDDLPVDLCRPNPCGTDANCRVSGERPVCSCPIGYEGNPLQKCIKGECIEHSDCPGHLACQNLRCYDPCEGQCGRGADCRVVNNSPICSCPDQYIGNPFDSCDRITERDLCEPSPCGRNTECKARNTNEGLRAVCSCRGNKIGNPLTGCEAECTRGSDCPRHQECREERCRNACIKGVCGESAICDVVNNKAVCSCPEFAIGDPYSRCRYECTKHVDCPAHQACSSEFKCTDPCYQACGKGADCRVDDHQAICSCPKGYTGHPYDECRAFTLDDLCRNNPCGTNADCTPGKDRSGADRPVCTCPTGYIGNALSRCERGECESNSECPRDEACYGYKCQSPCVYELGSVCGEDARCNVVDHQPICSCASGYSGNPLDKCYIANNARVSGGSSSSFHRRASSGTKYVASGGSRYYN